MALFDPAIAPFGKLCQNFISRPGAVDHLEHMERLWRTYQPFASPDFQQNLLADDSKFYSLTWEMMLGAKLLENGYQLETSKDDNRPDLCLIRCGTRIWIECSLPTGGDPLNPISVTENPSDGECHKIDTDKSILRC